MSAPIPKMAGVCGWPIHHSLSPLMHSFWLREMGIPGAYVHFAVRPDGAHDAFRSLKKTSIQGVNVTLPLKTIAHGAADRLTPDARKLGVVNCLYKDKGDLVGHNTDLEGFAAPLLTQFGARNVMNVPALVIGTGGAAQAVIGALLSLNCPEIRVCGRTDKKTEDLCEWFNVPSVYPVRWEDRHMSLKSAWLLVNASSGGMQGKSQLDLDLSRGNPELFVYDLIYTPKWTGLLSQAKSMDLRYLGGLDMLVGQARPSFKFFFGEMPPEDLDPRPILESALAGKVAA